jgi:hypothetical protein
MAQVWSNGLYKAPLHRVLTHESSDRFSAPFFYNPGYRTWVRPIPWDADPASAAVEPETPSSSSPGDRDDSGAGRSGSDGTISAVAPDSGTAGPAVLLRYHPVLWGYYRAVRFAGDLTDLGVEIQISDFERVPPVRQGPHPSAASSSSSSTPPPPRSKHVDKQRRFADKCNFSAPFSVEAYRDLLQE